MSEKINYGLIGNNISYSLSPKIYGYWLNKYSITEEYCIIDIIEKELNYDLIKNHKGLNVTKPFKQKIIPFLSELSKEVKFIKAVNLIINKNSKSYGYNTDYLGLLDSYKHYKLNLNNKNILILGAGGASRALLYSLKDYNCKIYLYNRTKEKIKELVKDFNNLNISEHKNNIAYDFVFNATSTSTNEILININIKKYDNIIYYDLNYYHNAEEQSNHIDGLYMLISQAKYNFYKFFGIMPEIDEKIINYIKNK